MLDDPFKYGLLVALAIALLAAAFTDLRHRRIGNWLNGAIALAAPLFWWASGLTLWPEIALQLGLALGTFAVLAVLFAVKAMGGGDVKLLTALALWIRPEAFLFLIMLMALIGGVLTVIFGARHIMRRERDKLAVPYGIAIALAGLWTLGAEYLPATAMPGGVG